MTEDIRHPSLRIKKIQGKKGIFEVSLNMDICITWQYIEGEIYLRSMGRYDKTLKNS